MEEIRCVGFKSCIFLLCFIKKTTYFLYNEEEEVYFMKCLLYIYESPTSFTWHRSVHCALNTCMLFGVSLLIFHIIRNTSTFLKRPSVTFYIIIFFNGIIVCNTSKLNTVSVVLTKLGFRSYCTGLKHSQL